MLTAPPSREHPRFPPAWRGIGAALLLCGCGPRPPAAGPVATSASPGPDAGFLAPPTPATAARTAEGATRIAGRAPAGSLVRLASPQGEQASVAAGADGGWSLGLGPSAEPRLFALSAQLGGRTLRAEGALAVLPAAAVAGALLLRSGAPASPIAATLGTPAVADPAPRIASVDFDAGGGFAASGFARPGATVTLTLDGTAAGQAQADGAGRFAVLGIAPPAAAGPHEIAVRTRDGTDARRVAFSPPQRLGGPVQVAAADEGWRIDWAAPTGTAQSVVTFARRPAAAPASASPPVPSTTPARSPGA